MPDRKLNVAVLIGSTRTGRFGPVPARWIAEQAAGRDDFDVDVIDLAQVWLPDVLPESLDGSLPQAVRDLAPWLTRADAFVIVTPEYNQSFPASLKNAIDWYVDEWKAKPVAFVSYGGIAGGLRAVSDLRAVFPGLHAVTVRDSVCFPDCRDKFDDEGRPKDPEGCAASAKSMLDQLAWWGRMLRTARAREPYPG
ncbi:NADPH-dependent FMN reductase [Streptomyces cavernicola]|uniref:NAD(P)H-dependent oxidoreductase n=1 Tax=Streptomyces cavernicola TaxID=3043613 RepID=A0ABT6SCK3_9ACTN|nr:NAD(P)H-dependent oxidoreductase [Streptomyces sp. B-S-A6]MDI3405690.1 NAD(P)H-dependent oxidoreductase [Streptomyces sp. B-S-A6]